MRVPLPILYESIVGPEQFSKEAHVPKPEELILKVREKAPYYVTMPKTDDKFDFDLIVQLKFAALGDWLVLYDGLYISCILLA